MMTSYWSGGGERPSRGSFMKTLQGTTARTERRTRSSSICPDLKGAIYNIIIYPDERITIKFHHEFFIIIINNNNSSSDDDGRSSWWTKVENGSQTWSSSSCCFVSHWDILSRLRSKKSLQTIHSLQRLADSMEIGTGPEPISKTSLVVDQQLTSTDSATGSSNRFLFI